MIFTRHFGALAARPVFASITVTDQEHAPEQPDVNLTPDHSTDQSAA